MAHRPIAIDGAVADDSTEGAGAAQHRRLHNINVSINSTYAR